MKLLIIKKLHEQVPIFTSQINRQNQCKNNSYLLTQYFHCEYGLFGKQSLKGGKSTLRYSLQCSL